MKELKRMITIIIILALVSIFFAFAEGQEASKEIVIGFANFFAGVNAYTALYTPTFDNLVKETEGVSAINLDARGDPAIQMDQVNDLIAKKVDVILLWPVDGVAIIPSIKKAYEAGIPVLVTNSPVDKSAYDFIVGFTGPDNITEGYLAGELMVEGLGGKGKVVELTGTPGYVTSIERHDGFVKAISKYPDIILLDSQPCNWDREKANKVMENFLVRYPDIDGVYCCDSGSAMGALAAIKEAGREGIIMTDATLFQDGYDAIQKKEIYGSVYQSPVVDATLAFETAVKVARGEKVPFFNYMHTPKVDIYNVHEFERPLF
ncbi:sugar transporter [Candidatus Atribacteria bacterium HGW-Atribacteria-1]|nr:MAG: sugar transporter [Candidatus Atribacteria bacterium HGW-Atribacteria-1]